MRTKTFEDARRRDNQDLIKEVLNDGYLSFSFDEFSLREGKSGTGVSCDIIITRDDSDVTKKKIEGTGKGLIDALFDALIAEYVDDCVSLYNLSLEEFYVFVDEKDLRARKRQGLAGTDAMVETCLVINNGIGSLIPFRSRNRSIVLAMLEVVLSSIEFFINCEMAILALRRYVDDAESRNRQDLVRDYTLKMAELVKNGSYVESLRGGTSD